MSFLTVAWQPACSPSNWSPSRGLNCGQLSQRWSHCRQNYDCGKLLPPPRPSRLLLKLLNCSPLLVDHGKAGGGRREEAA